MPGGHCSHASTALNELVSRHPPHPISREKITESYSVPQEHCHFDSGKGAFIHSASA
ncbi:MULTISPECIES: T3SS effector NleG family protein [Citrobacter]|uniref:T3SS effector NleG family protein n=1 Tax=Citrobacter TaxID=544 RepID=UPI0018EA978E|nr:T3SS effector NleG family protein [Citrobacter braakii]